MAATVDQALSRNTKDLQGTEEECLTRPTTIGSHQPAQQGQVDKPDWERSLNQVFRFGSMKWRTPAESPKFSCGFS